MKRKVDKVGPCAAYSRYSLGRSSVEDALTSFAMSLSPFFQAVMASENPMPVERKSYRTSGLP